MSIISIDCPVMLTDIYHPQFGGIPMNMMELFHREKITRYEEVPGKFAALGMSLGFDIPGYRVEILGMYVFLLSVGSYFDRIEYLYKKGGVDNQ